MAPQNKHFVSNSGCRKSNTKKGCENVIKEFVIFSIEKLTNNLADFCANCLPTKKGDIEFIR